MARDVQVIQGNYRQSRPCSSREYYESKRRDIRRLRKYWSNHPDVHYWANSLGLDGWSTAATVRRTYDWPSQSWIDLPRDILPNRLQTGLVVSVVGPVGRLPEGEVSK